MQDPGNTLMSRKVLPVEIILAPEWWYKNTGITFDRDFFFHPLRRVEDEQKMEAVLYEKWGTYGLGESRNEKRPEIGAVHLAAGFLLSEMMGCRINYTESHPPQVISAQREDLSLNVEDAFRSEVFKQTEATWQSLKKKYGYLTGDINWGGILNLALDLRGDNIFTDMMMTPDKLNQYFSKIAMVIEQFTSVMVAETGSTSISVNRGVRYFDKPVFLHSECSHTMISNQHYEEFLLPFDIKWSSKRPFGIHYCGSDPHRMAESFAKIPHLDYLDLGWGGHVKILRNHLPHTFFSIRLSPVELVNMSRNQIFKTIHQLIDDSANPYLTGICCINMDDRVTDDQVTAIFEAVEEKKKALQIKF